MAKSYNITFSIFSRLAKTLDPAFSRLSLWFLDFLCEFFLDSLLSWNIKLYRRFCIRVI